MTQSAIEKAQTAIEHLSQSERGRFAVKKLKDFIDSECLGLDRYNQAAIHDLLDAAWKAPTTVLDLMQKATGIIELMDEAMRR